MVQHTQYLDHIQAHPVNHDEGRSGYHELAGVTEASGSTQGGVLLEIVHGLQNALAHFCRRRWMVLGNVIARISEISQGAGGPSKFHVDPKSSIALWPLCEA